MRDASFKERRNENTIMSLKCESRYVPTLHMADDSHLPTSLVFVMCTTPLTGQRGKQWTDPLLGVRRLNSRRNSPHYVSAGSDVAEKSHFGPQSWVAGSHGLHL